MREIFGIQTDIAEKVADRLNVKLSGTADNASPQTDQEPGSMSTLYGR
jgi:hypothetical protein